MPATKKAAKRPTKKAPMLSRRKLAKAPAALSRRTITIRPETGKAIDALVGPRKFSAFVQAALDHELQRERIDQWLAEQEAAYGPLNAKDLEFAEKAWQSRK
jgi:hypothetical protein